MADLSTLDPTQPPDTQLAALGAARIRETRGSTITSFGIEHYLTGEHKIPVGNVGARPASGHLGRLFVNTDSNTLQYDTGSGWVDVLSSPAIGFTSVNISAGTNIPGTFASICNAAIVAPGTATAALVLVDFGLTANTSTIFYRELVDLVPTASKRVDTVVTTGGARNRYMTLFVAAVASGLRDFQFQVSCFGGTGTTETGTMAVVIF